MSEPKHRADERVILRTSRDALTEGANVFEKEGVVLARADDGSIRAASNRCRHMGGQLKREGGCRLRCPRHGWVLDAATMTYENPRGLRHPELRVECGEGGELTVIEPIARGPWSESSRDAKPLAPNELVVRFYAHACIEIVAGGRSLFTDPWLFGPAFARGWWLAHRPPEDALDRLAQADAIYISHNHSDHLNPPTLRALAARRPDIPVYVPGFDNPSCARLLADLGLRDVRVAPFSTWIDDLGPLRFLVLPDGTGRDDSGLLVEYAGRTILNTVDCRNPGGGELPENVDLLLTSFAGGASGFPVCWEDLYGAEGISKIVEKNLAIERRHVVELVTKAKPRVYAPFAGYFVEAHPADEGVRATNRKNTPEEVAAVVTRRFPDVRPWLPEPGIELDLATLETRRFAEVDASPEDMAPYVAAIHEDGDFAPLDDLAGVQAYFAWAGYRGDLHLHVIETTEDFGEVIREFFVDFRTGIVSGEQLRDDPPYLRMRVRSDVFRHVLRNGLSWEEISIGFQARFYRKPDVYNFDFWNHFQDRLPTELPAWASIQARTKAA